MQFPVICGILFMQGTSIHQAAAGTVAERGVDLMTMTAIRKAAKAKILLCKRMGIPELVGYYTAHLELLEALWKDGFSNITDEDVKKDLRGYKVNVEDDEFYINICLDLAFVEVESKQAVIRFGEYIFAK